MDVPPLSGMLGRGSWSKLTCIASRGPATGTDPDVVVLNKVVLNKYYHINSTYMWHRGMKNTPLILLTWDVQRSQLEPYIPRYFVMGVVTDSSFY